MLQGRRRFPRLFATKGSRSTWDYTCRRVNSWSLCSKWRYGYLTWQSFFNEGVQLNVPIFFFFASHSELPKVLQAVALTWVPVGFPWNVGSSHLGCFVHSRISDQHDRYMLCHEKTLSAMVLRASTVVLSGANRVAEQLCKRESSEFPRVEFVGRWADFMQAQSSGYGACRFNLHSTAVPVMPRKHKRKIVYASVIETILEGRVCFLWTRNETIVFCLRRPSAVGVRMVSLKAALYIYIRLSNRKANGQRPSSAQ